MCVCVFFVACERLRTCVAFVTVREHIQLVPLSVFLGSLVLQAVSEGGITACYVCVNIIEIAGREASV